MEVRRADERFVVEKRVRLASTVVCGPCPERCVQSGEAGGDLKDHRTTDKLGH